jgi:hypothetical protein
VAFLLNVGYHFILESYLGLMGVIAALRNDLLGPFAVVSLVQALQPLVFIGFDLN